MFVWCGFCCFGVVFCGGGGFVVFDLVCGGVSGSNFGFVGGLIGWVWCGL